MFPPRTKKALSRPKVVLTLGWSSREQQRVPCCEVTWDYDDPDTSSASQPPVKLQEYLLKIGCILIPFSAAKQPINIAKKMFTLL